MAKKAVVAAPEPKISDTAEGAVRVASFYVLQSTSLDGKVSRGDSITIDFKIANETTEVLTNVDLSLMPLDIEGRSGDSPCMEIRRAKNAGGYPSLGPREAGRSRRSISGGGEGFELSISTSCPKPAVPIGIRIRSDQGEWTDRVEIPLAR